MKVLGWQDFWIYAIFSLFKNRIVPKSHLRKKNQQNYKGGQVVSFPSITTQCVHFHYF